MRYNEIETNALRSASVQHIQEKDIAPFETSSMSHLYLFSLVKVKIVFRPKYKGMDPDIGLDQKTCLNKSSGIVRFFLLSGRSPHHELLFQLWGLIDTDYAAIIPHTNCPIHHISDCKKFNYEHWPTISKPFYTSSSLHIVICSNVLLTLNRFYAMHFLWTFNSFIFPPFLSARAVLGECSFRPWDFQMTSSVQINFIVFRREISFLIK